jgi:hypothetical protein
MHVDNQVNSRIQLGTIGHALIGSSLEATRRLFSIPSIWELTQNKVSQVGLYIFGGAVACTGICLTAELGYEAIKFSLGNPSFALALDTSVVALTILKTTGIVLKNRYVDSLSSDLFACLAAPLLPAIWTTLVGCRIIGNVELSKEETKICIIKEKQTWQLKTWSLDAVDGQAPKIEVHSKICFIKNPYGLDLNR